ncbi:hypothetical protein QG37_04096 [Candidozyma auris]|nr:hypothetical protein QG37_04096 [[Candida] auris]
MVEDVVVGPVDPPDVTSAMEPWRRDDTDDALGYRALLDRFMLFDGFDPTVLPETTDPESRS